MARSLRVQSLLEAPKFHAPAVPQEAHKCQINDSAWFFWAGDSELQRLGWAGPAPEEWIILVEAVGALFLGKSLRRLEESSFRELEAWLRDRNSQAALGPSEEALLEAAYRRLREMVRFQEPRRAFVFPSEKSFAELALAEQIRELKAFFSSDKLAGLARNGGRIELLDLVDFDVIIALDNGGVPRGPLLDWLQLALAESFREPRLNLIPEEF